MKNIDCNKYEGAKLPPCAGLLKNPNPIIKDGKIIFRNLNKLFYFIGIQPKDDHSKSRCFANIQISLPTYITGILIDQFESNKIKYKEEVSIHSNKDINEFIHKSIKNPTKFNFDYKAILTLLYSNIDAVLTPFQHNLEISLNNFLILLTINRMENNPLLLFVNNSDATEDILNFILSEIDINFKLCE